MIEILLNIKMHYYNFLISGDKYYKNKNYNIYRYDLHADESLLNKINILEKDTNRFYNSLRYLSYLYEYDYLTEQEISSIEFKFIFV